MFDYYDVFRLSTETQKRKMFESYKTYVRIKDDKSLIKTLYANVDEEYQYLITDDYTDSLRQLSNSLFDATKAISFFTGLYSLNLVNGINEYGFAVCGTKKAQFDNDVKMTKEHALGRKAVSERILERDRLVSFHQFVNYIYNTCFVNMTTVEENMRLSYYYQDHPGIDWFQAYEGSGVKLCTIVTHKEGSKKFIDETNFIPFDELRSNFLQHGPYYYRSLSE